MESRTITNVDGPFPQGSVTFIASDALELQRGIKPDLSCSDLTIGPANQKRRIMSIPSSAPAAMMDVNEEDIAVGEVEWSGFEQSATAKEVCGLLRRNAKCLYFL